MALPEPEAEDLLIALLGGELDPAAPAVRDLFQKDPALHQRYLRMRALAGELDQHGDADRRAMAEARTPSPFDAIARQTVLRHQGTRRRTFWWPLLLAAAGLLVAAWFGFGRPGKTAGEDHTLGGEKPLLEQVWPADQPTGYGVFRWYLPLKPGQRYVLHFRTADADPDEGFAVGNLTVAEWRPSAADLGQLAQATQWEIDVLDAAGKSGGGAGPLPLVRR